MPVPLHPRLRDRSVLDEGIVDMPMIWQTDAFALASGYDESTGRYVGLWAPTTDGKSLPPAAKPIEEESAQRTAQEEKLAELVDEGGGSTEGDPNPSKAESMLPKPKIRFYGVKTLNSSKIAMDFKCIAQEVIANLRADDGTELIVRIEIEATNGAGFGDGKVRTVTENANSFKFDQSGMDLSAVGGLYENSLSASRK